MNYKTIDEQKRGEEKKLKYRSWNEVPTRDGENSIKIGSLNLHNIVVAGEEKLEEAVDDQSTDNCEPHDRSLDNSFGVIGGLLKFVFC